jgi:high frequency lysogenization protein
MKPSIVHYRTLALAGVFQAASLVKQLAKTGRVDEKFFLTNIESIFKIEANSPLEVYGNPNHLKLGLSELTHLFGNHKLPKDSEIARYAFSLLHLERKLSHNPKMLAQIRTGIARATTQASHFSSTHENVMANLASLYTDTLSTFTFKVYVSGEPLYLNQTQILNKIRSILLSGIRSAVLWQQLGGRRWQLLIARSSLLETADQWLKEPETMV